MVLTLCAAAVLAGMGSFTAIAGWVADVPAKLLAWLYARPGARLPSKTTLWRVLTGAHAPAVDAAVGAWLLEQAARRAAERTAGATAGACEEPDEPALVAIAVDGKTVRGAIDSEGNQHTTLRGRRPRRDQPENRPRHPENIATYVRVGCAE